MNGFFDGQFRRTPNVSMGGANKKLTKDELLAKAQKEREQRQVSRAAKFFLIFFSFLIVITNNAMHFSLRV